MTLRRIIDRISNLEDRPLKIFPHSANQLLTIQFIQPIHGNTPPGHSKPGTLFNHHD
jgi:hypothetical protein